MFALAALSVQSMWERLESSTVRPVFYFLTVSHFTVSCQELWGQRECMEISAMLFLPVLSCSNILSPITKSDKKRRLSTHFYVTQRLARLPAGTGWAGAVLLRLRWGDVPAQARSGAVVGGRVKWFSKPAYKSLKRLTDSSLMHRPWSWSRCERGAAHIDLMMSVFCKQPGQTRRNDL